MEHHCQISEGEAIKGSRDRYPKQALQCSICIFSPSALIFPSPVRGFRGQNLQGRHVREGAGFRGKGCLGSLRVGGCRIREQGRAGLGAEELYVVDDLIATSSSSAAAAAAAD